MNKRIIYLPKDTGLLVGLQKNGIPHETQETNYTTLITTAQSKYLILENGDRKLTFKDFGVITTVKKEATEWVKANGVPVETKIPYFKINEIYAQNLGKIENVIEIDITKAYATVALNMEIITQKTFGKICALPKEVRLMVLGSLATRKRVCEWNTETKQYDYMYTKENDMTRPVFFEIAAKVDEIMRAIYNEIESDCVFYWFDALFVKNKRKVISKAMQLAEGFGISFAPKKIGSVSLFRHFEGVVTAYVTEIKGESDTETQIKIKTFSFASGNKRKQVTAQQIEALSNYF